MTNLDTATDDDEYDDDALPDVVPLYEQLQCEPDEWYARLLKFFNMGPKRSLRALYNEERRERQKASDSVSESDDRNVSPPQTWREIAQLWKWEERAADYDQHVAYLERMELEDRRRAWREKEHAAAQALIAKAEKMLDFPIATTTRTVRKEGDKTIITQVITPGKWTFATVAAMAGMASKLGRLALGLDTAQVNVGLSIDEVLELLPDDLRDEVMTQLDR